MISLGIKGLGIANKAGSRPSLNLDFINSQIFDPRITFTRASTATRVGQDGLIEVVASGSPRIDFDPVTQVCKGLLIEEQRINLLTYSEQFDNAAWAKFNATVTANAVASPDGTVTADKLVENTSNLEHYVDYNYSITSGITYAMSVYVKGNGYKYFRLRVGISAAFDAIFNLQTGQIHASTLSNTTITPVGNDWYRVSGSFVAAATGAIVYRLQLAGNATSPDAIYTGDGTSGLYIWGAQLEVGSFATSYIPSEASQVTRSADTAVMTGTNFSSWYNQTEGTVLVDYDMETSTNQYPSAWYIDDGLLNRFGHSVSSGLKNCNYDSITNSVAQLYLSLGAMPTTVLSAYAYKENDFVGCANGGTVLTDTSGVQPIVNKLQIGGRTYGAYLNGHISKLSYYPKRLTNSELQALTTG